VIFEEEPPPRLGEAIATPPPTADLHEYENNNTQHILYKEIHRFEGYSTNPTIAEHDLTHSEI
jgi:hypothetical protein